MKKIDKKLEKARINAKKLIDKSDSFIIVFSEHDGGTIKHFDFNISASDKIVALECVKHKCLYKHMVKSTGK